MKTDNCLGTKRFFLNAQFVGAFEWLEQTIDAFAASNGSSKSCLPTSSHRLAPRTRAAPGHPNGTRRTVEIINSRIADKRLRGNTERDDLPEPVSGDHTRGDAFHHLFRNFYKVIISRFHVQPVDNHHNYLACMSERFTLLHTVRFRSKNICRLTACSALWSPQGSQEGASVASLLHVLVETGKISRPRHQTC